MVLRDLAEGLDHPNPPPEPDEWPKDWPQARKPALSQADQAKAWVHGYATHAKHLKSEVPKRDNRDMTTACQRATGCTVDEVRAAYSALPPELRNPTPAERQATRGNADD